MEQTLFQRLWIIQSELNAPKSKFNSFGKYAYRSAEDIIEAAKPLLREYRLVLMLSDRPITVDGWHYIEATATLVEIDSGASVVVTACAREPESKKGMDDSQITGGTSSYARKYALNGMFLIDDEKDADAQEPPRESKFDMRKREAEKAVKTSNEQAEAKNRCWRAVKAWAAKEGLDAAECFKELTTIEGFDDSAGFWTAQAVVYEMS